MKLRLLPSKNCSDPAAIAIRASDAASGWFAANSEAAAALAPQLQALSANEKKKK